MSAGHASARSIVEAMTDPAIVLDGRSNVLAANGYAEEALGPIRLAEHIGRSLRQPTMTGAIASCIATGQKTLFELSGLTAANRRLDGTAARLTGLGDDDGAPRVLVVLKDISEREALARMRMEFVANASHELRTPLAALSGFIETLRGPAKTDLTAHERFLGIMAEQAQRMTRLIDDLLLLSRVEMKAHIAPTATADLNHVASEALKIVSPLAGDAGTTLEVAFANAVTTIQGDHDELVQAVQNLLSNAVKYGRPSGKVAVRVETGQDPRLGPAVRVSVTDDGPGIAAEHLPRLTERFYRVSTPESRDKGGTGLGLAIVKHIAMRHRGRIDLQSALGRGTIFTLVFPQRLVLP